MMCCTLETAKNVLCGQIVSLFSTSALLLAKRLAQRETSTPILLNLYFYLLLAIVYLLYGWRHRYSSWSALAATATTETQGNEPTRWWVYAFLALLDVQANVCAVKSLAYTSFATSALMLNLAVPIVFTLCVYTNRIGYTGKHLLGCMLTVFGGMISLSGCLARQQDDRERSVDNQELTGWALAFLAAALYASSNIVNQWCLKTRTLEVVVGCLGRVGLWGVFFCTLQVALIERHDVMNIQWTKDVALLFFGYTVAMFAFYTAVFVLVRDAGSTVYNMSLLLSSGYVLLMSKELLGERVDIYTWGTALVMVIGLALYTWSCCMAIGNPASVPHVHFKTIQTPRPNDVLSKMEMAPV